MKASSRFLARWRSRGIAGVWFALVWLAGTSAPWSAPPQDGEEPPYPYYVWSSIHSIAYSRDGKMLASGEGSTMEGEIANVATVWDLARKGKLRTLKVKDQGEVRAVAYSPDGKTLVTASFWLCYWDAGSGKEMWSERIGGPVTSIAFSPDGKILAVGWAGGGIVLWDVARHARYAFLAGHREAVNSVAFSPDGRFLASAASDSTVRIWDVAARKEVKKLVGHGDGPKVGDFHDVYSVAWSPDGKMLASVGGDKTVRLWDAATGEQIAKFEGGAPWRSAVAWSADGKTLFSVDPKGAIREWNVSTGKEIRKLSAGEYSVSALCLSPDGKSLAAACLNKFMIWDLQSGRVRTVMDRKPIALMKSAGSKPIPIP